MHRIGILLVLVLQMLALGVFNSPARAMPTTNAATQTTPAVLPELPAAAPVAARGGAPTATSAQPPGDFAPGLAIFAVLAFLVIAVMALFAIVASVIGGILLLILLLLGIFSLSMLYGLLRRSVTAAARAIIIQLAALCGMPVGILLLYAIARIGGWTVPTLLVLIIGLVSGAAAGASIGWLFTKALSMLFNAVAKRFKPAGKPVDGHFPVEVSPVKPPELKAKKNQG